MALRPARTCRRCRTLTKPRQPFHQGCPEPHWRPLRIEPLEDRRLLSVEPFPVPLQAVEPLGSLVYEGSVEAEITTADETDSFTIDLDDGQTVTVLVEPEATLQPSVELKDPDGITIGAVTSSAAGESALLQTIATTGPGTYTMVITDAADATGSYTARLVLNAVIEDEQHEATPNNDLASAQDLQPSFIMLGVDSAARGAVLGTVGEPGDGEDWYRFALEDGQSASVVLKPDISDGISVGLYDEAGVRITWGLSAEGGTRMIDDFVDPADGLPGEYFVRVGGDAVSAYRLLILRDAGFDPRMLDGTVVPTRDVGISGNVLAYLDAFSRDEVFASDAAAGDSFGTSVAISGDTAVVGAHQDDDAGSQSGAAYTLRWDGRQWIEQQKLTASDGAAGDFFGISVAISGDMAIVGADRDSDAGGSAGSAYVFQFNGDQWVQQQKLRASDAAASDEFGRSVAISGDVTIVGSYGDDDAGSLSGSAYVFQFDGDQWTQRQKLTASDAAEGDYFGYSVAISGNTAIVGAYRDDDASYGSGSAYIFQFDGSQWVQRQKLTASDAASGDSFGQSVAISDDMAIVGAPGDDGADSASGSAYVFRFDGNQWVQQQKLTAADAAAGDVFAKSVSIVGDLAIVGAEESVGAGSSSGSAYIFQFDGSAWVQRQKLVPANVSEGTRFGLAVATNGTTSIIGAGLQDGSGLTDCGAAYIVSPKCEHHAIHAVAGDHLTITTATPRQMPGAWNDALDPIISLYDPNGTLVGHDDNSGPDGRNAWLEHTATSSGVYTARVSSANDASAEYVLGVVGSTGAPPPLRVVGSVPAAGDRMNTGPAQMRIDFDGYLHQSTVEPGDLLVGGIPAVGVTILDNDTVLFDLPLVPDGMHAATIGAAAILDLRGTPNEPFHVEFLVDSSLDLTGPRVVESSILAGGAVPTGSLVYTARFDEELDARSLDPASVGLIGLRNGAFTPDVFEYDPATSTLRLEYAELPEDSFTLILPSGGGRFEDLVGNDLDGEPDPISTVPSGDGEPGGEFLVTFRTDIDADGPVPLATPLTARSPHGSLVYKSSPASGTITDAADIDRFSIDVDPGQTVTVVAGPDQSYVHLMVALLGPEGTSLGSAVAPERRDDAILQDVPTGSGGLFTVVVGGYAGTVGEYSVQVILNAAEEEEGHPGYSDNDSPATAQDLDATMIDLGDGWGQRGALLGQIGQLGDPEDWYRFTLDDGQTASVALQRRGLGAVAVGLYDKAMSLVAVGVETPGGSVGIGDFLDTTGDGLPDTYFVRVAGEELSYTLVVLRDAAFDLELPEDPIVAAQDITPCGTVLGTVGAPAVIETSAVFAAVGDYGADSPAEAAVSNMIRRWMPDFIITTGDNRQSNYANWSTVVGQYYGDFILGRTDNRYPEQISPTLRFFPSVGNHDGDDSFGGGQIDEYLDYFHDDPVSPRLPEGVHNSDASYYDFQWGSMHFFVLDSDYAAVSSQAAVQQEWLQETLALSTAQWRFVYFHRPPYSSCTTHGSTWYMRWPFAEWGADAVFSGHNHVYERLLVDDLLYFTTCTGGSSLYAFGNPIAGSQFRYNDAQGAMRITVDGSLATYEFLSIDDGANGANGGRVIDSISIQKPGVPDTGDPYDEFKVQVNAGDWLVVQTATPADGPGQFDNGLDPILQLYAPDGTLLAQNDNGAADGRNARLEHTAAVSGTYRIRVLAAEDTHGEYVLNVEGATGSLPAFEVVACDPPDGVFLTNPPVEVILDFSRAVLLSSLDAADLLLDGVAPAGYEVIDGDTIRFQSFSLPGGIVEGPHELTVAPGAIFDVQGTPLEPFTSMFTYDITGPRLIASSLLQDQAVVGDTLDLTVQFDEPLDASALDPSDVELLGLHTGPLDPDALLYDPTDSTLTLRYSGLADDDYTLTLFSGDGRFEDRAGNDLDGERHATMTVPSGDGLPGGNFTVGFRVDLPPQPLAFAAELPLGSLVYRATVDGRIHVPADSDVYTFDLEAGQTISALLTPGSSLQPTIVLRGPDGGELGEASASTTGYAALIQTRRVEQAGVYTLSVDEASDTADAYSLQVALNAALDFEHLGLPPNDEMASAMDLESAFLGLGDGAAQRAAVLADGVQGWYRFTLDDGQTADVVALGPPGLLRTLELYDQSGALLAVASPNETWHLKVAQFVDPPDGAPGTYLVHAEQGSAAPYRLVVTRGAAFSTTCSGAPMPAGNVLAYLDPISHEVLIAADAGVDDGSGSAVAVSGEMMIVGADGDDIGGSTDCGSAYVFRYDGHNWVQQQKLTASDAGPSSRFGCSVALGGSTAVVGAYGSAYVFRYDGTRWVEQQKLTPSDGWVLTTFGQSVAIDEFTILVGGYSRESSRGGAYVFQFDGSRWVGLQVLTAFDATSGDCFGRSVALSGDTALIGADGAYRTGDNAGLAYVFQFDGTAWSQRQKLWASDSSADDRFGCAVAVHGDTAVIGADGDDAAGTDAGAAYLFELHGAQWVQQQKITAPDAVDSASFGGSVATSGDLAVVGAQNGLVDGVRSGAVYVFRHDGEDWTEPERLTAACAGADSRFGYAVAVDGQTIAVGATRQSSAAGARTGAAHVYTLGSAVSDVYFAPMTAGQTLTVTTATPGDQPGEFVNHLDPVVELYDPHGNLVAADDNGGADGRNAFLQHAAATSGVYTIRLLGAGGTTGEYFLGVDGFLDDRPPLEVSRIDPADGMLLTTSPAQIAVTFSDSVLVTSLDAWDLTIDDVPVSSVALSGDRTARFDVPGPLPDGPHVLAIPAGAVADLQGTPVEPFSARFTIDSTGPRVVESSILEDEVLPVGDLVYTARLDEPLNSAVLDASDVYLYGQLSGRHVPVSFEYDPAGSLLTVRFSGLPDDRYTLRLTSGPAALVDPAGNPLDGEAEATSTVPSGNGTPGGDFVVHFHADSDSASFPVPLRPVDPLGSLVYQGFAEGDFSSAGDEDRLTIDVDAGQTLAMVLESPAGVWPVITVFDPLGQALGTFSAGDGEPVLVQGLPLTLAGTYTLSVRESDGNSGQYTIRLILNANLEREPFSGPSNNEPAAAEDLDGGFLALGDGAAQRAAVLGTISPWPGEDWYRFTLEDGQAADLVLTLPPGTGRSIELYDEAGTLLAKGPDADTNTVLMAAFVDASDGSAGAYYVRVGGPPVTSYSLVVSRSAASNIRMRNEPATPPDITPSGAALGCLDPVSQQEIMASDPAVEDRFGWSVSVSGNVAVVGAKYDDDVGIDSGSAYIYRFDGTHWTQQQKLTASDGALFDYFGYSVAISADTAVVGAYGDDDAGSYSGSVYIYRFDGTQWMQEQKLTAFDGEAGDYFGYSVAISGNTAVVGAYRDYDAAGGSGSAYVFHFDGTQWTQQQKLTASDRAAYDYFGYSVSISGNTALVGAYGDDDAGSASGSAYIYRFDGTQWTQQQKLTASDGAADDYFGWSVALSGDTAVVGAYADDDAGSGSGSAYVFQFDGTQWTQQQKLTASDVTASDYFGYSVSISGNTALVGARYDDDAGNDSGSAYVFRFDGTQWTQQHKLTASNAARDDRFGTAVAVSGSRVVVGAPYRDAAGVRDSGAAYVYMGDTPRFDPYTINVNAGDELVLSTTTPGGGPGEFVNLFDPAVELYDPDGNLVAGDDNGGADGRNVSLQHTALMSGAYTIRVLGANNTAGEYFLQVAGHTGDLPAFAVAAADLSDGARLDYVLQTITLDLNDPFRFDTLEADDLTVAGAPATAVTIVDADTVTFELPPLTDGSHEVSIAAGAILDLQNTPLEPFSITFGIDTVAPRLVQSSLAQGDLLPPGPLVYTARFDEPLDAARLDPADFVLTGLFSGQHVPAAFGYDPATSTLTVALAALPEDDYLLRLASSNEALTDLTGNLLDGERNADGTVPSGDGQAGGHFELAFTVDISQVDAAVPARLLPLGSMTATSLGGGRLHPAGDVDEFRFAAQQGQLVSVQVSPSEPGATLSVEWVGVTGPVSATQPGRPVEVPLAAAPADGTFTLRISGDRVTEYELQIVYGAAVETNDSGQGAEMPLDDSLVSLGPGRYAVLGTSQRPWLEAMVWAVQPAGGEILMLDPTTGIVLGRFPAPDALAADHTQIGLTIAQWGRELLYVNSDVDPTALYHLHPLTGEVFWTESIAGGLYDGLGFEPATPDGQQAAAVFLGDEGTAVVRRETTTGAQTNCLSAAVAGAIGGDESGRQFAFLPGVGIVEFDPFLLGTLLGTLPAPADDVEGLAFDGRHLFASTASGMLYTLDPDTGDVLAERWLPGGGLYGLAAVDGRLSQPGSVQPRHELADWTQLITNGGFETGGFTGWVASTNGLMELTPWTVGPAGGGFFFNSSPLGGTYSAYNGFDGEAGLQYELYQQITIPADVDYAELTTNHRLVYSAGGQPRSFQISVRDSGGTVLETLYTETIPAGPAMEVDLGWNGQTFDLSAYAGQTVQIHFQETIPGSFAGPALLEFDSISLEVARYPDWHGPEIDRYRLDLTGKAGHSLDVVLAGQDGADFSGQVLMFLDTDGQTVLATAVADPLGTAPPGVAAENCDLAILDFVVPADGVYTLYIQSAIDGQYGLTVTEQAVFSSEPNGDPLGLPLRSLDATHAAFGFLGGLGEAADAADCYHVTLAAGQLYRVYTSTPWDHPGGLPRNNLDVALAIVSPAGLLIATDADSAADGRNAYIELVAPADGAYAVAVAAESGCGEYLLRVGVGAEVTGRHVFYNNSAFDGDDPTANGNDDNAIATDKIALLPGQTASFQNYTSYARGINGVMVDIAGLTGTPTAADFQFRLGNSDDPGDWATAPEPSSVSVRPGEGVGGSDRVTLIWPDYAIQKQWLQVTVLATANTGLTEPDVFYFGNAVADAGNSTSDARVNATDMLLARNNPRTFLDPAATDFPYDYNRDARVNATDMLLARNNQTHFLNALKLITVPAVGAARAGTDATKPGASIDDKEDASPASLANPDWYYELALARNNKPSTKTIESIDQLLAIYGQ
ncbi:MAG: pre-peptidase C-terminal domain-containing protein [Pirellulales bacterium]|nr:pre-peptidase C-terminal domain-containing protein [Pirellulales bacterium]